MNYEATSWAWRVSKALRLRPPASFVLLALAKFHNGKSGRCNPSHSALSAETRFSGKTIERCLCELKAHGLVSWEQSKCGGRQSSNRYTLHFDVIEVPEIPTVRETTGSVSDRQRDDRDPVRETTVTPSERRTNKEMNKEMNIGAEKDAQWQRARAAADSRLQWRNPDTGEWHPASDFQAIAKASGKAWFFAEKKCAASDAASTSSETTETEKGNQK